MRINLRRFVDRIGTFLHGCDIEYVEPRSVMWVVLDQILMFPMTVAILVSVALICGGRCSLWQWWGAVILVMIFPFCRNRWRRALVTDVWFMVFLFVLWVLFGIFVTRMSVDCHSYHYPVMRMLMMGWNPVWESTCEAVKDAFSNACGTSGGFSVTPVCCMARPVWYFSAVASLFSRNLFDMYHPIVLLVFFGAAGCFWKFVKASFVVKLVSVIFIASISQLYAVAPDVVTTLSAFGLLVCHYAYLKERIWGGLPMVCFSFWLCSAKISGALFCAILWVSFAVVVLVRERSERRKHFINLLKIGGILAFLFVVANTSPYITGIINYHHPLYPQYTVDQKKFPARSFIVGFDDVNEDAKKMLNRTAMFVNSFVSSDLVRGYYSWRLDKPDFRPRGTTWKGAGNKDGWDTQLMPKDRYWIMIPIVLMLIFGGLPERFVSLVLLLCAISLPVDMIGFIRYVEVVRCSLVFCFVMLWPMIVGRHVAKYAFVAWLTWFGLDRFCKVVDAELKNVDDRLAIYECFCRGLPDTIYYNRPKLSLRPTADLALLRRLVPQMAKPIVRVIPEEFYNDAQSVWRRIRQEYPEFPDGSCRIPGWYGINEMYPSHYVYASEKRPRTSWGGAFYDFRMFWHRAVALLPRAIYLRIVGRINNHFSSEHVALVNFEDLCAKAVGGVLDSWGLDIRNGIAANDADTIKIDTDLHLSQPDWMKRKGVRGAFIEGSGMSGICILKFPAGGDVAFNLTRGHIVDNNGKPIPFFADFVSFSINGKEMLVEPVSVYERQPHCVVTNVESNGVLNVSVRLRPHVYSKENLGSLLIAASKKTFVTEDVVDRVLAHPALKQYVKEESNK